MKFLLSLITWIIHAFLAFGQDQAPKPPQDFLDLVRQLEERTAKPKFPSYWSLQDQDKVGRIAIFVRCYPRKITGCVVAYEPTTFPETYEPAIVVGIPGYGGKTYRVDLPPTATDAEILAATTKAPPEEVRQSPAPFVAPSRNNVDGDGWLLDQQLPRRLWPHFPEGTRFYRPHRYSQSLSVTNKIFVNPFQLTESRWHQPGGLEGVTGWESYTGVLLSKDPIDIWEKDVPVGPNRQYLPRVGWRYPAGMKFFDLLTANGKPFTVRSWTTTDEDTEDGYWVSRTEFQDKNLFPKGFVGAGKSCVECHVDAGKADTYGGPCAPGDNVILSFSPFRDGTLQFKRGLLVRDWRGQGDLLGTFTSFPESPYRR